MDILIDTLMGLGWCIQNEANSHYFTSEIGPDEYDYIVGELYTFF